MFKISSDWHELLNSEMECDYYKNLLLWLNDEYATKSIFPAKENVFAALNFVAFDKVKVVIIGQDPYHGENQAHGLCFSVESDVKIPPSLKNIFKELASDEGCYIPNHGNLTKWAKQGVLLLNSVLTVEKNCALSHKGRGWEKFTARIIELLSDRVVPVVFLLWGTSAKSVAKNINSRHFVLTAAHPSPMSANRGGWFGSRHFSETNRILKELKKEPIDWQI